MNREDDKVIVEWIDQNPQEVSIINTNSQTSKLDKPSPLYERSYCDCLINLFCQCFKKVDTLRLRKVYINSTSKSRNFTKFENKIKNQKYNFITFFPWVLFNQFKFFNNQFYLLMALSQFFDSLKVGFLFSYIAPWAFVLFVTLLRELIDDCKRCRRDREQNTQKFKKIMKNSTTKYIDSSDIKIGDWIEITQNQRIPADMLVVKSFDNNIYIKTDQWDGETDWKLRKPVHYFQQISDVNDIFFTDCSLLIEPPSRWIYDFTGVWTVNKGNWSDDNIINNNNILSQTEEIKIPLSLENTAWMNAVWASKRIIGLVIYTGKETRSEMNNSLPKPKVGIWDIEVNHFTGIWFVILLGISVIITIGKGWTRKLRIDLITFIRFVVLWCSIIPISLKINLDISKSFFSHRISNDTRIPGAIARNSTLPEEWGRVEFIFTDKTGTWTKNEMIFKRIAMEIGIFQDENKDDLKEILKDECRWYSSPMSDIVSMINKKDEQGESSNVNVNNNNNETASKANNYALIYENSKRIRRNRTKIIRDSITAITLCNNVTPIFNSSSNSFEYQASSPDEIALVQFSESVNMRLTYRDDQRMTITNTNDEEEHYDILAIFPFSSETKRMGIVLKHKKTNNKIFYLKGAENVVLPLVKDDYASYIQENAESLASSGWRTLVIAQKLLEDEFYDKWINIYHEALVSMDKRKEKIDFAMKLLENKLEFLCVTGVEDKLQDEVLDTIDSWKNAGIKVWMLTGDKVETATCIAISTGWKGKNQRLFYIKDYTSSKQINDELEKLKYQTEIIIIVDGNCLDICWQNCEKKFFEVMINANSVVCCRCSPLQKAKIIRWMRKYTTKRWLAIGDGGNDVAMIQEANVGVGIVGKEGKQASLSADFSINQFKDLKLLLLWFGRISYKNTSKITHFVIHRGWIISFWQFIFSIMFYCVPIAWYNGNWIVGYTSVYTALPVISWIYDQDTNITNVIKFPSLYKDLQKGRELSTKTFLGWVWKSLFQSGVIMVSSIWLFDNIFLKIVTVTFTCLIFAEWLNVYIEIKKFNWMMCVSICWSLISYILSWVLLKSVLDWYYLNLQTIVKVCVITFVSWFPFYSISKIKTMVYPEAHEKLNLLREES